jgi:hypothetical protein
VMERLRITEHRSRIRLFGQMGLEFRHHARLVRLRKTAGVEVDEIRFGG